MVLQPTEADDDSWESASAYEVAMELDQIFPHALVRSTILPVALTLFIVFEFTLMGFARTIRL